MIACLSRDNIFLFFCSLCPGLRVCYTLIREPLQPRQEREFNRSPLSPNGMEEM